MCSGEAWCLISALYGDWGVHVCLGMAPVFSLASYILPVRIGAEPRSSRPRR